MSGRLVELAIRTACPADARAVAALHAESWRRYYRGAYSDSYLDVDLDQDRLRFWSSRLATPDARAFTLVADRGAGPIGLVHVELDADPTWGALIDNLHVLAERQGERVGTGLLRSAAERVVELRPESPLYVWVLEQNTRAQAFYLSLGGRLAGRDRVSPPKGDPRNLTGEVRKIRIVWRAAADLLRGDEHGESATSGRAGDSRVRAAYDAVANEYDAEISDELTARPLERAMFSAFLELTGDGLVADIGCGPGHVTRYLAAQHPALLGIDLSPHMVRLARMHDPNRGYVTASMLALPVEEATFSGAIALYSIIHLTASERAAVFAQLARAVEAEAWLLIAFHVDSEECAVGDVKRLTSWFGTAVDLDGYFLDPALVTRELELAGFAIAATLLRQPNPQAEYPSRRCYILARRSQVIAPHADDDR